MFTGLLAIRVQHACSRRHGRGYSVLVSLNRGRRVVLVPPSSFTVVEVLVRGSVVSVGEVSVLDVVVASPGLMSVVTGGLVLVTTSVLLVVVADEDDVPVPDALGSR